MRWRCKLLVARQGHRVLGLCALHQARHRALPDANLRAELNLCAPGLAEAAGGNGLLFIGGHFALWGGLAVTHTDPFRMEAVLAALTSRAVAEAVARVAVPAALYVPHDQVPGMAFGWRPTPTSVPSQVLSVLHLQGARSMDQLLARLRGEARGTWRHDRRLAVRLGITAVLVPLSDELVVEAAPLIAAVKSHSRTRHA